MAQFKIVPPLRLGTKVIPPGIRVKMNDSGTVSFFFGEAEVDVSSGGELLRKYTSRRGVILASDGAQVLPYFKNSKGEWQVVMVEQFRIALEDQTLEAPGGEVSPGSDAKILMSEELAEEANINVNPFDIEIVFCEYIQPSMMNAKAWGGIVEIKESDLPKELLGGEWDLGEYTFLVIKPLVELLKSRDESNVVLDLWNSRLIDELAKKLGLLEKHY